MWLLKQRFGNLTQVIYLQAQSPIPHHPPSQKVTLMSTKQGRCSEETGHLPTLRELGDHKKSCRHGVCSFLYLHLLLQLTNIYQPGTQNKPRKSDGFNCHFTQVILAKQLPDQPYTIYQGSLIPVTSCPLAHLTLFILIHSCFCLLCPSAISLMKTGDSSNWLLFVSIALRMVCDPQYKLSKCLWTSVHNLEKRGKS